MQRRDFLRASVALAAMGISIPNVFAAEVSEDDLKSIGGPHAFDYAWLKGRARSLASVAYRAPTTNVPRAVKKLDWDQYQQIRYRGDHALWAKEKLRFRAQFFHLGLFYQTPVRMHELINGEAKEIAYDPGMFTFARSGLKGNELPKDLGFAGVRINYHIDWQSDVAAFLGASYFRAVGRDLQYGISARGLAIDCGMDRPEEFPTFTDFWLEKPTKDSDRLTVYALMDSPSVAGAYRFDIYPGATLVMEIDAALYPRKTIERLGIAPLTSMFQFGENDRRMANDWRPEIHDSDGLAMWTGAGEWIWRPLTNPANLHFNAYVDEDPRGFGLLQRDRNFDHYQDDGAHYDRRPSLWVAPKTSWGKGSIQLVELPTTDETSDNIVVFWNPEKKPQPGQELLYSYRLHWGPDAPVASPLAHVVATRDGIGGIVGQKRKYFSWRFIVDFAGGDLPMIGKELKVESVVSASRGKVEMVAAHPLESVRGYRAWFDLKPTDNKTDPINLRLFLRGDGRPLSETWIYQWTPPTDRRLPGE